MINPATISDIHIYQHDLPVVGGVYRTAHTEMAVFDTTIVEIVTESGTAGYGETCPHGPVYQPHHGAGARAALREIAPRLIGQNALNINCVVDALDAALCGHGYAKAALDIALWDLCGKFHGTRVCDLMGGARQETVPSYFAIGVMSPEDAAAVSKEHQAQGYRRLQLKVGGRDTEIDIAAIRKVHETLQPGVRLIVDANRGWTTRDTIMVSQACRNLSLVLEQPCDTLEEMASLRGRICHPVFLDESADNVEAIIQTAARRICDGYSLKVTRMGGLSAMGTIRDVCRVMKLPITCDDAWGGDIIAAACTHIAATVAPAFLEGVWLAAPYIQRHYDPKNGIRIKNGSIRVPGGLGLGVEPDVTLWGPPVASFS